jgi:trans-aconitate methyltransferase
MSSGGHFTVSPNTLPGCSIQYRGFDWSYDAIEAAKMEYGSEHAQFEQADLNQLKQWNLPRFDLVLALGLFHLTTLDGKDLLMQLVNHHLHPKAMLVATFPNCTLQPSGLKYGAKMKNFSEPDLSVLLREVAFYRRYLHGKGFRTRLFGKHYWFLTAWRS